MTIYVPPRGTEKLPLPEGMKAGRRTIGRSMGAGGPALLVTAVIYQAVADYCRGSVKEAESARRYFMSEAYRGHLEALGLSVDMVPEGIPNGGK